MIRSLLASCSFSLCLLLLGASFATSTVLAQEDGPSESEREASVALHVAPYAAAQSPWIYEMTLTPVTWGGTVIVADHRLLSFEVQTPGSRRKTTCTHPDAPSRTDESRAQTLVPDGQSHELREWIDLRMYCFGRSASALVDGALVTPHYGFRSASRGRWVARHNEAGERGIHRIEGEPFTLSLPAAGAAPAGAIEISLRRSDVRSEGQLSFEVSLRSGDAATHRVYVRDDLFRFDVEGPLGHVECALTRQAIVPIVDFYKTLTPRRGVRAVIQATRACPDHTFELPGIYDVTPTVDLVYDGERYELETVTGTFSGERTPLRIRVGNGRYFERLPETHPVHAGIDRGARP